MKKTMVKVDIKTYFNTYDSFLINPEDLPKLKADCSKNFSKIIGRTEIEVEMEDLTELPPGEIFQSDITNTEAIILRSGGRGSITR